MAAPPPSSILPPPATIDALINRNAKRLKPGQSITFTLVKGPTSQSADPMALARHAKKQQQGSNNNGGGGGKQNGGAERLDFPRIAKFPETTLKPNWKGSLHGGRFYEEDVPKAKDESDDEEEYATDGTKKKKRRWRKNEPPKRHWVLQERKEFLEKMRAKARQRKMGMAASASNFGDDNKVSSRYEGTPESNPSCYVLMSVKNGGKPQQQQQQQQQVISVVPIHGFHSFVQPARLKTLSMHEAEDAIENQRKNMTRYMMHGKASAAAAAGEEVPSSGRGRGRLGPPPKGGLAKARLFGKISSLKAANNDPDVEDDDIMADLAFRTRKGGNVKARKELLTTLGDEGVTVDDDGVLGGTNDSEFAPARRFGRLALPTKKPEEEAGKDGAGKAKKKDDKGEANSGGAGNDGRAMGDDFYQRDVAAEYEEMDYDASEQFDDDDVDVGAEEVIDSGGGFGGAEAEDDGDDDDEYDEEGLAEAVAGGGAEGFATVAGFKAMMARGELPDDPNQPGAPGAAADAQKGVDAQAGGATPAAAGADATPKAVAPGVIKPNPLEPAKKPPEEKKKRPKLVAAANHVTELDKNGQKLVTLDNVRREIWLNHGSIRMKRLMKLFNINKKASQERRDAFRECVKELCTMKNDPVDGNMLVLKQHYSNMG